MEYCKRLSVSWTWRRSASLETFQKELVDLLPRMRRFAQSLAGSPSDSEDLVQSAVERALRSWKAGVRAERVDSWVFKILQNLWIDEVRRRRRAQTVLLEDDLAGEDGRTTTSNRMDLDAARAAMRALPSDQQAVLSIVVIDGMSYQQAAEVLDVPIGTIMSRLARARRALAQALVEASLPVQGTSE
jgi:RNA polymerase sigma-70 factor (ECF subfamily)